MSEGLLAALPGYKGPDVYSRRASSGQGVRNHHPRLRPPDGGAVDQGEARSNPNFYVYVVENVGQGDPAEFMLRVLAVRGYNGCWSGLRGLLRPWSVADYDAGPLGLDGSLRKSLRRDHCPLWADV